MKYSDIRKISVFAVYSVLVCLLTPGCAELRDKFIRKPKEEEPVARSYYAVKKYDVDPSLELYTKRYTFWKNWHKEILAVLSDDNQKKIVVAVEQSLSNLMDMRNMLVDEEAEKLQVYIDKMSVMEKRIKEENVTLGNEVRIRRSLESIGRAIKTDFNYNKMKGSIRAEFKE